MRPRFFLATALALAGAPLAGATVRAQSPATAADTTTPKGPVLTLDQAISLALKNNPAHLQTVDNQGPAAAQLRSAYASLLPSASARLGGSYQKQGQQVQFGTTLGATADVVSSSYFLGVNYSLSPSTFLQPKAAKAGVNAAREDIASSAQNVRNMVTQQYVAVLESQAKADLADTVVTQKQAALELAKAKLTVGSGTQLDVSNAAVAVGQAKVLALQAHNQVQIDKLTLFQQIGIPEPAEVQLVSTFPVIPVPITLDSALALANSRNPTLRAMQAREKQASVNVTVAKMAFLPSLNLSTGWGGYTYSYADGDYAVGLAQSRAVGGYQACLSEDSLRVGAGLPSIGQFCATNPGFHFTAADAAAARAANNTFPFDFTKQPFQVSVGISLPIFNGLQRADQLEQAQAQREDARYDIRKQQLQNTQTVTAAYLILETDHQTIAMQQQNAAAAKQALELAQEKYRVGAASFIDLNTASVTYATAESDYITAVYEYHKAFAALEAAVGRPLR